MDKDKIILDKAKVCDIIKTLAPRLIPEKVRAGLFILWDL